MLTVRLYFDIIEYGILPIPQVSPGNLTRVYIDVSCNENGGNKYAHNFHG